MNIAVQSVQKEKRWKEEDHTESAKEELMYIEKWIMCQEKLQWSCVSPF
jgi:hypothetical protein